MSLKGNIEAKQEARGKINYLGYNEIQEKIAKADAAADAANKAAEAANDVAEKGAPYAERLFEVEKTLDEVFDDGFKSITKDSPEISRREDSVYFDRNGNLEINANYTTYYINASEDFELFFDGLAPLVAQEDDSIHSEMLYLVVFGSSNTIPSNVRVSEVFSTEEYSSRFPYSADRKLRVYAGETVTISVAKKDPNNEYSNATIYFDGTKYVDGFLLRYNQGGVAYVLTDNVALGEAQKIEVTGLLQAERFANAIKGQANGNPIRFDDVSPLAHEMAVGLKSKNLLPYPYTATTQTVNGITFTDNGDGTITANGTATEVAQFYFDIDLDLPVGSVATFSGLEGGTYTTYYVNFTGTDIYLLNKPVTFTFTNAIKRLAFTIAKDQTVSNLVFKPQIELGTTATAYTPFVDVNGASVQKYGKNLLRIPDSVKPFASTLTQTMENGIVSLKGTLTLSGVASVAYNPLTGDRAANYVRATTISLGYGAFRLPRGSYTFSESQNDFSYMIVGKLGTSYWNGGAKLCSVNCSFEVTDDETYGLYLWQIDVPTAGQEYSIEYTVSYPQLEIGTTATEYEPYAEPTTYTADENGKVEGIIGNGENMTLMADSGVVISAEYNIDTKKYIDKKFAELQALILEV